ncbi:MAG: LysR family transcriptional regulator [Pseudomonadales bacterium]|jgi:DNA-binding transcriptional LysR family regulator|nr:LysR family transcriptional regulator [Pseudomonadales bacterium]
MDTQDLAAFVAIVEGGSFSTAALRLALTQSAVSRRIAALENRLGARLFDRVGRSVALTEAGHALLPRARAVLAELDDARTLIRNLGGAVTGPLRLGTSHHIGLHRLPPVLRRFSRAYPDVDLDLHFLDSEAARDLLLRGRLDLAVVTLSPGGFAELECTGVWEDPLSFATGPDHPLARAKGLTLAQLAEQPAVLPAPTTFTGRIVTGAFAARGLTLGRRLETNYLETVRMMANIGLGWTVLPKTMIDARLVPLDLDADPQLQRTLGWMRHPGRTPTNATRAFLEVLASAADPG